MRILVCLSLVLFPALSFADKAPSVVVIPIVKSGTIAPSIVKGFDKSLRKSMGANGKVVSVKAMSAAMTKAGVHRECDTDDCGVKVAQASGARFVVFSKVTAADEIYTVKLLLFDAALSSRVKTVVKECELCAAKEVTGTLEEAVGALRKPMSKPAPAKVAQPAPAPKAEGEVSITVTSEPTGATVSVGGVKKGATPAKFTVKPGAYTLKIDKVGHRSETRKITALDRAINLKVRMKAVAIKPIAKAKAIEKKPAPVVTPALKESPDVPAVTPAPSVGTAYNGAALGMIGGGLALGGLGTYLVMVLDGKITCAQGSRRECPTVYNAKGLGLVAFGAGAALIGAGSALLIEDYIRTSRSKGGVAVGAIPTKEGAFFNVTGEF